MYVSFGLPSKHYDACIRKLEFSGHAKITGEKFLKLFVFWFLYHVLKSAVGGIFEALNLDLSIFRMHNIKRWFFAIVLWSFFCFDIQSVCRGEQLWQQMVTYKWFGNCQQSVSASTWAAIRKPFFRWKFVTVVRIWERLKIKDTFHIILLWVLS